MNFQSTSMGRSSSTFTTQREVSQAQGQTGSQKKSTSAMATIMVRMATVLVTGTFELDPADREAFLRGREEGMRRSRAEDGCVAYVFAADPLEPGRVILFEEWASEEALAAHAAALRAARANPPAPAPAGGAPPPVKVLASSITRHVVASSGPLG